MRRRTRDRPVDLAPGRGAAVLCLLLLALAGCAGRADQAPTPVYDPALLSGERLFGEPVDPALAPPVAVIEADAAMRAYVAERTAAGRVAVVRLRLLIQALLDDGYFGKTNYDAHETLTAAQAFRSHSGNCLSFTNMFIAMAREAGLDAVYQVVDVPPSWDADSGFLIRYTHINVLLRNVRLDNRPHDEVSVDFNVVRPDPEHRRRVVSDDYAASLYHANHAMDHLRRGQQREAFAYLRRAIELAPGNTDLWVNLGALYGSAGAYAAASEAYQVALQIDPASRGALAGLARSHGKLGNHALAAEYEARARDYLERNPYYHLAIAQTAYLRGDLDAALASINQALELERRSGRLYFVRGLIEERRGELAAARESYRIARRLGVASPAKLERIEQAVGSAGF